jgi:hypothetical protein
MGAQSVQMKIVLPRLVRRACHAGTRDFLVCLGCSIVGPAQNIFFLAVHYFKSFVPIAQQAEHAVMLGHLNLSMRLCFVTP